MNCKPANTSFSPSVHASTSLSIRLGEDFINQKSTAFDTRFKFTGKEKDSETGYSYPSTGSGRRFGARYYDSDLSVWLSVDPMADERSWVSPYSYCQNNPIGRVDPTGALDDNYDIYAPDANGNVNITVQRNNDPTNTYTYHNSDGTTKDLGTYNVAKSTDGKNDMVDMKQNQTYYNDLTSSDRHYLTEDQAAGFLGATYDYYLNNNNYKTNIEQFMGLDYSHSPKDPYKVNKANTPKPKVDVKYVGTNKSTVTPRTNQNNVDVQESFELAKTFLQYGFGDGTKWSIIAQDGQGGPLFSGYANDNPHKHHMHIQGFSKKIKQIK
jgi:RHS repeat-associated protein